MASSLLTEDRLHGKNKIPATPSTSRRVFSTLGGATDSGLNAWIGLVVLDVFSLGILRVPPAISSLVVAGSAAYGAARGLQTALSAETAPAESVDYYLKKENVRSFSPEVENNIRNIVDFEPNRRQSEHNFRAAHTFIGGFLACTTALTATAGKMKGNSRLLLALGSTLLGAGIAGIIGSEYSNTRAEKEEDTIVSHAQQLIENRNRDRSSSHSASLG